jgi:hypothetical protein
MDSDFAEIVHWGGLALAIVRYLIIFVVAAVLFLMARKPGFQSFNLAAGGLILYGLSGLTARVLMTVGFRMGLGGDFLYLGVPICSDCVDVLAWALVAVGLLMVKKPKA